MGVTQPTPIDSSASRFDKLSFAKYVKDIGRDYREQAIKLVSLCRSFAQAQKQIHNSYEELRSMLQVVDDALYSATEAGKKSTKKADAEFKKATDALNAYEKKYHPNQDPKVTQMMAGAKAKDKSSSTVLKRLKERLSPFKEEPTKIVEFLLHKSLPDNNPTIVKQVLSQTSDTKEILWNFSRFKDEKRLTLKDNPHFYKKLPTSAEKYKGQFRTEPVESETFRQQKITQISVLTDRPGVTGRLFLETAKKKRAFGNVWVPKEAIIFKDVCGKLEGENIVGSDIENIPNLWCFEEPSPSIAPWPSPPDRSNPSPTTTATPTTSSTGALLEDWREPILRMLRSQGVKINIRFSDKFPSSFRCGYSEPSLPSPLPDSNSIVGILLPSSQSRPTLELRIPGACEGPQPPSSYKTARSTPLAERPLDLAGAPSPPEPLALASNVSAPTGPAIELLLRSSDPPFREPLIFPTPAKVAPPTDSAVELSARSPPPLFPEPLIFPTPARKVAPPTDPTVELSPRPPRPLFPIPRILPTPTSDAEPTGPAVPDPATCPFYDLPLSQVSRVDLLPQADTATTATPSTGPAVPDPTLRPLPDTWVSGVDPAPEVGTAIVFPQPHIVEHRAQIKGFEVPAIRFERGATTNLANDLASGLIVSSQKKPLVQPPPKPKKHWYQKCFDVIKNTLRPGSS